MANRGLDSRLAPPFSIVEIDCLEDSKPVASGAKDSGLHVNTFSIFRPSAFKKSPG
jgi:hypothetical protein